jgi:exosortase B
VAIVPPTAGAAHPLRIWIPVLAGTTLLYLPTYLDLYWNFWRSDQSAYGVVILAMVGWLVWRERALLSCLRDDGSKRLGAALLAAGLLIYVLGRSQSVYQLDVGSQIPVLLGIVYLLLGANGVRRLWFPIALLIFLVPVPGSMLDQLLLPLKEWVSSIVDNVLHMAGYPIARNGVVLVIDSYSLLIADACSGLNSMVALSGIGLLYVYVAGHSSRWLNAALLLSILPIAFLANVIRVMLLVLVTYYRGDAAGQAFHDQAGLLEIALAFGGFFFFDHLMALFGVRAHKHGTLVSRTL